MSFLFEKLDVYQKVVDYTDKIIHMIDNFPKKYFSLRDQLQRATLSIVANIAEGNGRWTKADRKHFFDMSRASIFESVALLEIAKRLNLINVDQHVKLKIDLETLSKMEAGLIKGIQNRHA